MEINPVFKLGNIIPLLGIIFYWWILYTSDEKERHLHNSSIYATVSRLPDDDPKLGRYMSQCKIRIEAHRDGHPDCPFLPVCSHISNPELLYGFW